MAGCRADKDNSVFKVTGKKSGISTDFEGFIRIVLKILHFQEIFARIVVKIRKSIFISLLYLSLII